jgi:hypothetical protein
MLQDLNSDIKKRIFDMLETPSAYAIKAERNRVLSLIRQNKFTDEQTLWSINRIYWYEVSEKKDMFHVHCTDQIVFYDLEIALALHKNNYSYNDSLPDFEKQFRYNSLVDSLNTKLRDRVIRY